jgi:hypothetical protein
MNSYRCPRCGQPVPAWQPIHVRCLMFRLRFVIIGAAVFVILILTFPQLMKNKVRTIAGSAKEPKIEANVISAVVISDNLSQTNKQPTDINSVAIEIPSKTPTKTPIVKPANRPASTPTKTPPRFVITPTKIPSKTQSATMSSCPGAPPQRVRLDRRAWVFTKQDRLIVRAEPDRSGSEITRLDPGTYFKVINGPVCADNWSWWGIKTDSGIKGWVAEGGDNTDPYFICPQGH